MWFGRGAKRQFGFSTELESELDGVVFLAVGQLVVDTSEELAGVDWTAVEAAARVTLDAVATKVTSDCSPRSLAAAERRLAVKLATRTPVDGFPESYITASCRLQLSAEDERRTRIYYDAVRSEQLQIAIDRERLEHQKKILTDPQLARLWWLDRHQEHGAAMTWKEFDQQILSELFTKGELRSRTEQIARTITRVVTRLESEPQRQDLFLTIAKRLLYDLGWEDLLDTEDE
jgi:hypothetical protein